jgi:1-pyrroline-4-hydroxy-2-carboxylate deaminase
MPVNWSRVFPALTTQFKDDDSLDLSAVERHVETLVAAGIGGLTMCGSVGENYALEPDEKLALVAACVKAVRGRVPVLAGVAETTTKFACRFMKPCEDLGVDGFMVLPSLVYKTQPNETMLHFRTVARATKLPIMIYNNPVAYGGDVTPAMFHQLMDEENLVALKESSTDIRRVTEIKLLCGDRYAIFAGMDDIGVESVLGGARGFVAGIVNVFPRETVCLFDLALAGRYDEAMAIQRWLAPLTRFDNDPRFVHYMKFLLGAAGMGAERMRLPRLPIAGEERARAKALVETALATRPKLPDTPSPKAAE